MKNLLKQWRALRRGKAGQRFQDRFDRHQRSIASQSLMRRLLQPAAAVVLLLIGVVLIFIPGPAILFFFAGAGLLAGESRVLARALDWSEIRLRKIMRWLKQWWLWLRVLLARTRNRSRLHFHQSYGRHPQSQDKR